MNFNHLNGMGLVEGFAIIKSVDIKQTTKGSYYLDMILADKDGEINAKLWDYNGSTKYNSSDFIKVTGTLSKYNDVDQLRIEEIRPVIPEDNVDISEYVPSAEIPGTVMFDEIRNLVLEFEDSELKELVLFLLDTHQNELIYWPAARHNHHAIRGGLLMHTLSILRLASGVCDIYEFVNKELLYTGVILHDIAKLEEMAVSSTGIAGEYTVRGNLIGHLVGGAIMVDRAGNELGISEETLNLVEHMLISHHGIPEWGAAKVPMFVEAEILSQLDVLDARMYEMHAATNETEPGCFSVPQRPLNGRIVYNHNMQSIDRVNLV